MQYDPKTSKNKFSQCFGICGNLSSAMFRPVQPCSASQVHPFSPRRTANPEPNPLGLWTGQHVRGSPQEGRKCPRRGRRIAVGARRIAMDSGADGRLDSQPILPIREPGGIALRPSETLRPDSPVLTDSTRKDPFRFQTGRDSIGFSTPWFSGSTLVRLGREALESNRPRGHV